MFLIAIIASVKDWAELLHAVAWPIVALVALCLFRRRIPDSIESIIRRLPFERATSIKAPGVGEIQMMKEKKVAEKLKVPRGIEPSKKPQTMENSDE
jgi:hypothetical protein